MKLTEDDSLALKEILGNEIETNSILEKHPNNYWGMYYFGFDYERKPITLSFKSIGEAREFSQRVGPSLRSLGWFPITEKEMNLNQLLSETQLFLDKLYMELEQSERESKEVKLT